MDDRLPFGLLKIHRQAALVATEGGEEPGGETAQAAGVVAFRCGFDLDHVGTEFGEHQTGGWTHHGVAEFQHAQARERGRGHQATARGRR